MKQNLHPGNSGKATVILNYWKGGKKYSNKFKIVVRRYENPFATLKAGKVSVKNAPTEYLQRITHII